MATYYLESLMIDHRKAAKDRIACQYVLGELPESEREDFERHLFECAACAEEVRALLAQAQRLTLSCRDRQELQRGDTVLQAASQRMDTLRRAAPQPGLSSARADAAPNDKAKALDEAQRQ